MTTQFKASPKHMLPIIISLAFTSLLSSLIQVMKVEVEPMTMFPETPVGATLNMSIFIILIASMAVLIYILIRSGYQRIVTILIKISLITALFILFEWYHVIFTEGIVFDTLNPGGLLLNGVFTAVLSIALFRGESKIRLIAASITGSLTGTFLGASIPLFTSILLLAILSVYDVISVYKGPIGKIAEKADLEGFMGAVVTYGDLTIGMGDLVFYSMLVATVRINLGVLPFIAGLIGIFTGAYGSFRILERKEMFPGLPLSLILGLSLSILTDLILV